MTLMTCYLLCQSTRGVSIPEELSAQPWSSRLPPEETFSPVRPFPMATAPLLRHLPARSRWAQRSQVEASPVIYPELSNPCQHKHKQKHKWLKPVIFQDALIKQNTWNCPRTLTHVNTNSFMKRQANICLEGRRGAVYNTGCGVNLWSISVCLWAKV